MLIVVTSATAEQTNTPIFRSDKKGLKLTSKTPAEPDGSKEVCMRMALAVERYAVDNKGQYPVFFQRVIDDGYIKFPSNKNLLTGTPIKLVPTPGIPGESSYITIQRGRDVVGYIMIVYGRPTDLTEDYDLDHNGWPDGVGYCFSEMANLSDGILADADAIKKLGYRLFQNKGKSSSGQLLSINLIKKPVEKILVTMKNGSKKTITQFKDLKQLSGNKRKAIPKNKLQEIRIDLKGECHNLILALFRYITDHNKLPANTSQLIQQGYLKSMYINPTTGKPAKEVPFEIWSPGDFCYLTDREIPMIVIMDPVDRQYQNIKFFGSGSPGILEIGSDWANFPAQLTLEDKANRIKDVSFSREYVKVGKTHDLSGRIYISEPKIDSDYIYDFEIKAGGI